MVGEKIKKLVDNQQVMTRNEVAQKIGISENNLYKLYKKDTVNSKYLTELCKLFNVEMSYFFNEETLSSENLKITIKKDSNNSNNDSAMIEELRATLEKVEKEKDRLYNLLENMSNNYTDLISKVGKCNGVEGSQQKDNVIHNVFAHKSGQAALQA